jgi:iron complex transport system substrate-binding protein
VVALSPHLVEVMLAIGSEKRLVGLTGYPGIPDALASVPRVGSAAGIDRELLLQLQPDLVLAWASGNRAADLRWLQRQGVATYLSEPDGLEAIATTIERVGRLVGRDAAVSSAAQWRQRIERACSPTVTAIPAYYEIWPRPLLTVGAQHWLQQVMRHAGLANVFADQPRALLTVTPEALLARRPALRLGNGASPLLGDGVSLSPGPELTRPGPAVATGLASLCEQLATRRQP